MTSIFDSGVYVKRSYVYYLYGMVSRGHSGADGLYCFMGVVGLCLFLLVYIERLRTVVCGLKKAFRTRSETEEY